MLLPLFDHLLRIQSHSLLLFIIHFFIYLILVDCSGFKRQCNWGICVRKYPRSGTCGLILLFYLYVFACFANVFLVHILSSLLLLLFCGEWLILWLFSLTRWLQITWHSPKLNLNLEHLHCTLINQQTDRPTDRPTDRQTDTPAQTYKCGLHTWLYKQIDRQMYTLADSQSVTQTDRQSATITYSQSDRQTATLTYSRQTDRDTKR